MLTPACLIIVGYVVALAVPSVRTRLTRLADRSPDVPLGEWTGVQIPFGTVFTEELVFRGTLDALLADACGDRGRWLSAILFGLWHIRPARAAGDGVAITVVATTAAGLLLSGLRRHAGLAAPILLHLAVNVGGAIAPRMARRMTMRRADDFVGSGDGRTTGGGSGGGAGGGGGPR
ncbi:hypothetical protein NRB56_02180 [Nocardia sp. RB56]|uniref:CAAX prenyl protease 2/Lysostaphin resistance protein A-like domain-containing protein n=1 Tax=Nocardia aurantia TaxID=2585199 RepID=A0A7K0DG81_9NOCA|nr:hypothetical protein [Nocardia aurantia]